MGILPMMIVVLLVVLCGDGDDGVYGSSNADGSADVHITSAGSESDDDTNGGGCGDINNGSSGNNNNDDDSINDDAGVGARSLSPVVASMMYFRQ